MRVKAGVTGAAISFRNLVEISSGPVALCCLGHVAVCIHHFG